MTNWLHPVCASPGRVSGRSDPPPSTGEPWAGESAEETGELLQHICWGVQPKPVVGSPWSHGCRVSPSFLQSAKEWTENLTSTGMTKQLSHKSRKIPTSVIEVFFFKLFLHKLWLAYSQCPVARADRDCNKCFNKLRTSYLDGLYFTINYWRLQQATIAIEKKDRKKK